MGEMNETMFPNFLGTWNQMIELCIINLGSITMKQVLLTLYTNHANLSPKSTSQAQTCLP